MCHVALMHAAWGHVAAGMHAVFDVNCDSDEQQAGGRGQITRARAAPAPRPPLPPRAMCRWTRGRLEMAGAAALGLCLKLND